MTTPKPAADLLREAHEAIESIESYDENIVVLGQDKAHHCLDAAVEAARREGADPTLHFHDKCQEARIAAEEAEHDKHCECAFVGPMSEMSLLESCTFHDAREQAAFRRGAREAVKRVEHLMACGTYPEDALRAVKGEYADPQTEESGDACVCCGCRQFKRGPSGGLSQNIECCGCGARFNIAPGFPTETIRQPTKCPTCGSTDPKVRRNIEIDVEGFTGGRTVMLCDAAFHGEER